MTDRPSDRAIAQPPNEDALIALFESVYEREWDRAAEESDDRRKAILGPADEHATRMAVRAVVAAAAPEGAQPQVLGEDAARQMNAALCQFGKRWRLDGDYLRCRSCNRPHLASCVRLEFEHAHGCEAAGNVEQQPWAALLALLRPIAAPPSLGGEDAARYRWLRDRADGELACGLRALSGPYFNSPINGERLDAAIDAARAAEGGGHV